MKRLDRARVARAAMAACCTRRALTVLVLTICTAGSLTAASGSALAAAPGSPLTAGTRYLALGDSVTFGYQESAVVPAPNYHNAASFPGYPEQLGAELHVTVANAACPGETSASLIKASAQSNGCENTPKGNGGYRTLYPLHVHYSGSQLAYALAYLHSHRNTRLVSLMIGANDAFVCQETTKDKCASAAELKAVLATIAKNVHTILSAIRNKAHYHGQLAIVNYYSLDYASGTDNVQSAFLNSDVDTAAKPFHVVIANGFAELEAAAAHSGGHTCAAGLLTQLVHASTPCGIHPSYAGQALLAEALEKVIRL